MRLRHLSILLAAALACPAAYASRYTWHGDLMDGDAPAEGAYDLRVRSFANPDASKPLGEATELPDVKLVEGRFEERHGRGGPEVEVGHEADAHRRRASWQEGRAHGSCLDAAGPRHERPEPRRPIFLVDEA